MTAEVVPITRPYESPYVCDTCGADRACKCSSKGISRRSWENLASAAKKSVRNQSDSHKSEKPAENIEESPEPIAAPVDRHQELIDALITSVSQMRREMRKRFFAVLLEKFGAELKGEGYV